MSNEKDTSKQKDPKPRSRQSAWLNAAMVSVMTVLVAIGVIFWLFVHNQTQHLMERNFRLLALHGSLLTKTLASYESIFEKNIIKQHGNTLIQMNSINCSSKDTLKDVQREREVSNNDKEMDESEVKAQRELCRPEWKFQSISEDSPAENENPGLSVVPEPGGMRSRFVLTYNGNVQEEEKTDKESKNRPIAIKATIAVENLVKDFQLGVESQVFDNVLLADSHGHVLYQKHVSSFQYDSAISLLCAKSPSLFFAMGKESSEKPERCKSLLDEKNGKDENQSVLLSHELPLTRDILIGDLRYKIFAQAVALPNANGEAQTEESTVLLIGLVRASTFSNHQLAITPSYLVWLLFAIGAAVFLLPFLKLWTMGHQDRITIVDVLSLFFGSIMITALFVFAILYGEMNRTEGERLQKQLSKLASDIDETFQKELGAIFDLVNTVHSSTEFKEDINRPSEKIAKSSIPPTNCTKGKGGYRTCIFKPKQDYIDWIHLRKKRKISEQYPYFDQIAWIDEHGQQRLKWSPKEKGLTPLVSVAERPYFKHVCQALESQSSELHLMKKVRKRNGQSTNKPQASKYFWLEPVISMTTGAFYPILSVPYPGTRDCDQSDSGNDHSSTSPVSVVSISADLISLQQTVLPPGFGYAVVNSKYSPDFPMGQVLFHSEPKRNLRENFIESTDKNAGLLKLITQLQSLEDVGNKNKEKSQENAGNNHEEKSSCDNKSQEEEKPVVSGSYWGQPHLFAVHPLSSTPWALVVFADEERVLWEPLLHTLAMASILFGGYAILVIVMLFLGLLVLRTVYAGQGRWLWPDHKLQRTYQWATGIHIVAMISFAVLAMKYEGTSQVIMWGAILPLLSIFFLIMIEWIGKKEQDIDVSNPTRPTREDYRWDYLHMMISVLVLLSVVPAFGFFKGALDTEVKDFRHELQRGYQEHIAARSHWILDTYFRNDQPYPGLIDETDKEDTMPSYTKLIESDKLSLWKCDLLSSSKDEDYKPTWYYKLQLYLGLGGYFSTSQTLTNYTPRNINIDIKDKKHCNNGDQREETHGEDSSFIQQSQFVPVVLFWGAIIFVFVLVGIRIIRFTLSEQAQRWCVTLARVIAVVVFVVVLGLAIHAKDSFAYLWGALGILGGLFAFFAVLFLLPRYIVRRVFLLDAVAPIRSVDQKIMQWLLNAAEKELPNLLVELPNLPVELPNLLVVGPPGSGKSRAFQIDTGSKVHYIDLRDLTPTSRNKFFALKRQFSADLHDCVVVIDHLEYARGDLTFDQQKLELLEKLIRQKNRIAVVSDIHPLDVDFFIGRPPHDSMDSENIAYQQFRNRWIQVFQLFMTLPFGCETHQQASQLRPALAQSTDDDVANFQNEQNVARSFYLALWASCTKEEKLSLYHLATDHFLHADNPYIRVLSEKGLILIYPELKFMHESFRQFVITIGDKENIKVQEHEGQASIWTTISRPLIFAIVVVAVLLAITQESIQNELFAFFGIIPVLVPTLSRFFSIFRQEKDSS